MEWLGNLAEDGGILVQFILRPPAGSVTQNKVVPNKEIGGVRYMEKMLLFLSKE
jgi:hypothetical protein